MREKPINNLWQWGKSLEIFTDNSYKKPKTYTKTFIEAKEKVRVKRKPETKIVARKLEQSRKYYQKLNAFFDLYHKKLFIEVSPKLDKIIVK